MIRENIFIKGAREHNLKNIDVEIPRNKLVVITGLSGSGKSSLAFDTLYAEGQRRYVESLSAYARQFLGQMEKPDVDYIEGLSPAISIDQKGTSRNPRSTVGTVTEIHDYLRLLYARIGVPHCHICGKEISRQTVDQMTDKVLALDEGLRIQILAPVVRGRKGEYHKLLEDAKRSGFIRARVDGTVMEINEDIILDKNKKHTIEIVVDRLIVRDDIRSRLTESIETVMKLSGGILVIDVDGGEDMVYSSNFACEECGVSLEELAPRMFSFNNPYGACPVCSGIGNLMKIDPGLVIPDPAKSLAEGAIVVSGWNITNQDAYSRMYFDALAKRYGFDLKTPVNKLTPEVIDVVLYGTKGEKIKVVYEKGYGSGTFNSEFEGIINITERRYRETQSSMMKQYYEEFMDSSPCPECKGARLKPESLAVTVKGANIYELSDKSIIEIGKFFTKHDFNEREKLIGHQILKEINARLGFLIDVGLDYLTLTRASGSLSGGEAQRIRLATQIGSGLMGVLYILDEPSIGLHQKDNRRLLKTLKNLRDLGNTLVVVEHDEETMYESDHIIDIGPGAGIHGGNVVAQGTVEDIKACAESITGQYLSGKLEIPIPKERRKVVDGRYLTIRGARENNLKNINVKIPLGVMTCITGVSGSGKSSLINEILYKRLAVDIYGSRMRPGDCDGIDGIGEIDKVIDIDQSPIGRTPRSNAATYTGVFDHIREVFASTQEARMRGFGIGRFSFNVKGGRCEACGGDGVNKIEMHFLPDVFVPCEVCKGKRYNRETLEVRYRDKNISDILAFTVEDALEFFKNIPSIRRKMQTLYDTGMGYMVIGQPSTMLSGGEAQRVKLAYELSKRSTGRTVYILDEPTTGLHMADVDRLIKILQRLVGEGNTVIVIEHNLDVVKTADHIIDLGPEGGDLGGYVISEGTPEEVSNDKKSYTGIYLKNVLDRRKDKE